MYPLESRIRLERRTLLGVLVLAPGARAAAPEATLERLRAGGLVLFFRHADTRGEPCDRSFRIGDRPGQRNLSPAGRDQAARLGAALVAAGIPIALPVLAGPVFRARDTAELAFGADRVAVTDGLLADDYAGDRLAEQHDGRGAMADQHPVGARRHRRGEKAAVLGQHPGEAVPGIVIRQQAIGDGDAIRPEGQFRRVPGAE
ncbi:MAG: hypothetical protein EON47_06935, partial [Acetobacteraceae bacterium]